MPAALNCNYDFLPLNVAEVPTMGIDPSGRQDPRLTSSLASFKDSIRKQYNCEQLRMEIRSLTLTYLNPNLRCVGHQSVNILPEPCSETKGTFEDADNSGFALRVVFEAVDATAGVEYSEG